MCMNESIPENRLSLSYMIIFFNFKRKCLQSRIMDWRQYFCDICFSKNCIGKRG
nr:MAG TPA: hypothetical protein [Caudoviricetes sp.]